MFFVDKLEYMRKNISGALLMLVVLSVSAAAPKKTVAVDNRSFRISKNINIFNSLYRELDLNYVDILSTNAP